MSSNHRAPMTNEQKALKAIDNALSAERECNGYEYRLYFHLGTGLIYAMLGISDRLRSIAVFMGAKV